MKHKLGLVLSGGGENGAYQLGVWKYLTETGIAERIAVMSGTSVGALNSALFAVWPYDHAEHIWIPTFVIRPSVPLGKLGILDFFSCRHLADISND